MRKYYTFLLIGETGSGKTTLLDAFVNKLDQVQLHHSWRWKLVDQNHLNSHQNKEIIGKSKTNQITIYYINDVENKFNIEIIDSPGLGDTEGTTKDDETVEKFQKLFKSIEKIDYILLTVKSTENKMKASTKYIYNRIQQLFGVDAKDRFIIMCTFADGRPPLCIPLIKNENLFYQKHFTFNNSALYTPSSQSDPTIKFFWDMAINNISIFQNYIIEQDKVPLSLKLSKQVLQLRKYIEASIKTSQKVLEDCYTRINIAKQNLKAIVDNKAKIESNKHFAIRKTRIDYVETKLPKAIQGCKVCKVSCCQVCQWRDGYYQSPCTYFNGGRNCPKCPGQCSKSKHKRLHQIISTKVVQYDDTDAYKKTEYEKGLSGAAYYKKICQDNLKQIESYFNQIVKQINNIKQSVKKLQQIALAPKILTDQQMYKQMISNQKQEKKKGYEQRIKMLQSLIQKESLLTKITNTSSIYDLFPELKQFKTDIQKEMPIQKNNCKIF